eukprot:COSAG03_NODE_20087_length_324_cov_284.066667_1_plen_66_part_01
MSTIGRCVGEVLRAHESRGKGEQADTLSEALSLDPENKEIADLKETAVSIPMICLPLSLSLSLSLS